MSEAVGEALIKRWLGVAEKDSLPIFKETGPLRETACELTVCGAAVESKGRKHALLAFIITQGASSSSSSASKPGSGGFGVTDLPKPMLHWGTVARQGDRWQPPPAGWSTWPDVSHDARGGAWQTPFAEQQLPGGGVALTLLLQLPCDGPLGHGGLSFLVKTSNNKWLGNAATYKDFWYPTAQLPVVAAVSVGKAPGSAAADLAGPDKQLDMEKLAAVPVPAPAPQRSRSRSGERKKDHKDWRNSHNGNGNNHHHSNNNNNHHHHDNHHHQQHGQEPELPNAGRREKEPAFDETQVCTMSAQQLRAAAGEQLSAWVAAQHDLQVPASGLDIELHEWPVKGHPSTPFVIASAALWRSIPGTTSLAAAQQREPVLLLAAMGDVGLTGKRSPGLVLHWSAVGAEGAASVLQRPDAAATEAAAALPDGWSTLPDMSWDAGSGFWDTPMTRHLLQRPSAADLAAGVGSFDRPSKEAADMYAVLLRMPLQDVFCSGGLLFTMRTARRQWVRHATTRGPFYLDTSAHAKRLGISADTPRPASPSSTAAGAAAGQLSADEAAWNTTHAALTAAGLSEDEIVAFAASMPANKPHLAAAAASHTSSRPGSRSSSRPGSRAGVRPDQAAVLDTADAELAAHIIAQSVASLDSRSSSRAGRGDDLEGLPELLEAASGMMMSGNAGNADDGSGRASSKFLRDFEPQPLDLSGLGWGLSGEAGSGSDYMDVPELSPRHDLVGRIADLEHKAKRSLMHRYSIAADLVGELLPDIRAAAAEAPASLLWPPQQSHNQNNDAAWRGGGALAGLVAVAVWLRLSSLRLLVWNHNHNVKPREISAALDTLGARLIEVYEAAPQLSGVVLLALASAGRGGMGDMGQRIRDEILAIQQRNGCKGGMMEEWHQKLHNNSSPDDLAICQALLDYLAAGQDLSVYWGSLAAQGITPERLASFDRAIRSPPQKFPEQVLPQLTEDLIAYRRTLAAVHSGADLSAAIDGVLGYDAGECKGKRVKVEPLSGVATPRLKQLLSALLQVVQGSTSPGGTPSATRPGTPAGDAPGTAFANNVVSTGRIRISDEFVRNGVSNNGSNSGGINKVSAMMSMDRCVKLQALVVAARACLAPHIRAGNAACQGRLRDVLFLDLALELAGKGALEQGLAAVRAAAPSTLLGGLLALLAQPVASACLSSLPGQGGNAALLAVAAQLQQLSQEHAGLDARAKARHALSLIERLRVLLVANSSSATSMLQPTAYALAKALEVEDKEPLGPVSLLAEEVVRGSAAAALSQLLTAVEPSLRRCAGVGAWSIVSRLPTQVSGSLSRLQPCLSQLQPGLLQQGQGPVILVLQRLAGEEEVPPGVVGVVVLGDCPDVLSHAAVRARNCRVPVVACPSSEEAVVSHIAALAGKQDPVNAGVAGQLQQLVAQVAAAEEAAANNGGSGGASDGDLQHIRRLVHQLQAPAALGQQLHTQLSSLAAAAATGNGSSSSYSWDAAWAAVKGVWASQWNDRALAALRKARLPLQQLRMGVLLQPLLPARYSWVAHTVNPASGSAAEVSVQLVVGLGEVLVGNYPGRALSGVIRRDSLTAALQQALSGSSSGGIGGVLAGLQPPVPEDAQLLSAVEVVSYPSKDAAVVPAGMNLPCEVRNGNGNGNGNGSRNGNGASAAAGEVVFMARSDSNAEDLPGFAGAGLFDSLPSAPTRSVLIDYAKEPLVWDKAAAATLLWQCALAALAAEQAVAAADGELEEGVGQDVEGCVTPDGAIWLLQARPQV
ncbi:hypothetical protein OEZ85_003484 [Tetradesmus obliquus]|uniref:Pyruvate phosphate dikinase AMP/ATP-binding domain-containing protein n=1 Tax=Tetradesmus obliquus TaxID=3088 RepID=A0ABY8UEC8_TETOB|nr:hypothetical protein OEZ85_003484 [Tetradesmus obliquus]